MIFMGIYGNLRRNYEKFGKFYGNLPEIVGELTGKSENMGFVGDFLEGCAIGNTLNPKP